MSPKQYNRSERRASGTYRDDPSRTMVLSRTGCINASKSTLDEVLTLTEAIGFTEVFTATSIIGGFSRTGGDTLTVLHGSALLARFLTGRVVVGGVRHGSHHVRLIG